MSAPAPPTPRVGAPRLVLLSDHRPHAQRLARALMGRGVRLEGVVLQSGEAAPAALGPSPWNRGVLWKARRRLAFERHEKPFYAPLGGRVWAGGLINSAEMVALLGRIAPDYILVGTGKILHTALIETAKQGVFNVHPALLPWVRGSGVVGHALQNGVPIGATLHYIDAGIDTGALIERRLLPIAEAPATLAQLEAATDELGARLLTDVVETLAKIGEKPLATPQTARHPLFRWPGARSPRVHELVAAGRAFELFEAWKNRSLGAPDWVLPPDWMEAPFEVDA